MDKKKISTICSRVVRPRVRKKVNTLEYRINGGGGENNRGGLEIVPYNNNRGGWNNRGGGGLLGEIENSFFLRQTRICHIFM